MSSARRVGRASEPQDAEASGASPQGAALWWKQAVADDPTARAPSSASLSERVDVAVIGGGYVGLWTAIELKRREPSCRVAVFERGVCGSGASGRNNGFAIAWWSKLETLKKLAGADEALRLAQASADAVDELAAYCEVHAPLANFRRSGWLWSATSQAQIGSWDPVLRDCAAFGVEPFEVLSRDEVNALVPSPRHEAGVIDRRAGMLHPGHLVRAIRRTALEQGVVLHEGTAVQQIVPGRPATLQTAAGTVRADQVIVATNAWAAGLDGLQRKLLVVATDGIATPSIPDRLETLGWTSGTGATDSRQMLRVYRTTTDGRISFGTGGRGVALGGNIRRRFRRNQREVAETVRQFRLLFPALADVGPELFWSAAIDRSPTGLPQFGRLPGHSNVYYGVGWSGNGVAPALVGARILASLALETTDEWSTSGLVESDAGRFPPEPIRFLGAQVVRRAVAAKENAEDDGRRPSRLAVALSSLAPANIVPTARESEHAPK